MICCIFDLFCSLTGYFALTVIVIHLAFMIFGRKAPLKLQKDSFVVITGACMGIGRQMALEIAAVYQCTIMVVDLRKDLFDQISSEIKSAGGACECRYADLGSEASVEELNQYLLSKKRPINLFIYNAGVMFPQPAWEQT